MAGRQINPLHHDLRRWLLNTLTTNGPHTKRRLADKAAVSKQVVDFHLGVLQRSKLVSHTGTRGLLVYFAVNGRSIDDDAYQLWTGVDLTYPFGECFGLAASDLVNIERITPILGAASVIEARDFLFDWYNANNGHERATLVGQELAHTYGEENHPCNGNTFMRNGIDPANKNLWFVSESKQEMMFGLHYNDPPDDDFMSLTNVFGGDCP